jgi:hypothetical protein
MKRLVLAVVTAGLVVGSALAAFSPPALACEAGDKKRSVGTTSSCVCVNRGGQRVCVWLGDRD